jgi:hypothetical protein
MRGCLWFPSVWILTSDMITVIELDSIGSENRALDTEVGRFVTSAFVFKGIRLVTGLLNAFVADYSVCRVEANRQCAWLG